MDESGMSHKMQLVVMVLGELAFVIPAIPLYVFLVLPRHGAGTLPGLVPVLGNAGLLPSIGACIAVLAIALGMSAVLYYLFGKSLFNSEDVMTLVDQFAIAEFIPIYLAAGIGEEALFRLALLEPCGLLVSSLIFAAIHVSYWKNPLMLVYVFAASLLLGALYLFTGSFLLCIIVHAVYNFADSLMLKYRLITPRG